MINPVKNQESVTFGVDREVGIETADDNLSARVDAVLRDEVARLRRHPAMEAFLGSLDAGRCALDSQDEADIVRILRLSSGADAADGSAAQPHPLPGTGSAR